MTDNKNKDKQNNPNNPFGMFNQNKKGDGKTPKFNAYWIYGIIAVVFIIVQYYVSNKVHNGCQWRHRTNCCGEQQRS